MRFLFFKQKTADEMRISDWSSDVCSSDLVVDDDNCDNLRTAQHASSITLAMTILNLVLYLALSHYGSVSPNFLAVSAVLTLIQSTRAVQLPSFPPMPSLDNSLHLGCFAVATIFPPLSLPSLQWALPWPSFQITRRGKFQIGGGSGR